MFIRSTKTQLYTESIEISLLLALINLKYVFEMLLTPLPFSSQIHDIILSRVGLAASEKRFWYNFRK
jgi:hypothetical protein